MGGWNPIDDIIDIIEDVIDIIVDIVEDVISWIIPMPEIPDFGDNQPDQTAKGVLLNKVSANASIPIIYGTRKVGGNVIFLETSGVDNEFLYLIMVLSEGEIDDVSTIYVNDNAVTWSGDLADGTSRTVDSSDSNYYKADPTDEDSSPASLITVIPHYGTDTQTYDTTVGGLDNWTSSHRLRGLAYLAFKFTWNRDAFGSLPTIHAIVKGKKIYNPNLDGSITGGSGSHRADTTSTWEYSDNPVYQLLDYLRNTRFGMGIANGYFDSNFADWQTAGDVCDVNITPYSGASQIDLMNSHAVVDTSRKAIDNVKEIIKGCRGILNFTYGFYKIIVESTGSSSITLTEDNIIGGITVASKNKNSRYNRVLVNFINPDKNWQSDEVQFPPIDDSAEAFADRHATMKTADGDLLLEGRFDFPTLTNPYQAREMAEIILRRSRSSLDVVVKADGNAMELAIGDIVAITHATPSFSAKDFRVQGLVLNADMSVSLTLSEHQDLDYTFGTQTEAEEIPDTNLPNPYSVQTPAISLSDELFELFDGSVVSKLIVNITSTDRFVDQFEIEYKESTSSSYRLMSRGSNKIVEKYPVKEGVIYDVRCKAINSLGVKSGFATASHDVNAAFAPPDDVTNYAIDVVGDKLNHTFDAVSNLDLDFYEIRFSSSTSNTVYANTILLVPRIARPATSVTSPFVGTGTYYIKAVDKFGIRSSNSANTIISQQVFSEIMESVQTITEETAFSGTKTNCTVVDNALILNTGLFDSGSGDFDDADGLFDGGDSTVVSSGSYAFATAFDLSNTYKFKVLLNNLNVDNLDYVDSFDSASGNFDSRSGLFDGATNASVATNVQLQIATSTDGSNFSSFTNFQAGDYVTRAVKFKAVLTSSDSSATPKINNLSVKISLPKMTIRGSNISSTTDTSGKTITFSSAFYSTPSLTVIGQNMGTGDFFTVTSKSRTGFTIEFFDSGGNTVDRTFDYQANGIGMQQ
jgi:hypothetical protein